MDDARLFLCARCQRQVRICSHCDRGQQYCGTACSGVARGESVRAAGQRYQRTRRGQHCHAERQRRYQIRCREGAHREKMTHHRSAPARGTSLSRYPLLMREATMSISPEPATTPRCHFCTRPVSDFLRLGWKRSPVRRTTRASTGQRGSS